MDPFLGEIRAVGFNYAPNNWALCQGQLLPINQNSALFALLGTTYGGDGRTTFGLPDLRGRLIVHPGQGAGLSRYTLGQLSGTENTTLLVTQLPTHTHGLSSDLVVGATTTNGSTASPAGNVLAPNTSMQRYSSTSDTLMATTSVTGTAAATGGSTAHSNIMPYLSLNYIIALAGIFPQRS